MNNIYYFAQSTSGYGCLAYGETEGYDSCNPVAGTTTTEGSTASAGNSGGIAGTLQDTGASVLIPLIISAVLIAAAIALFVKRKA